MKALAFIALVLLVMPIMAQDESTSLQWYTNVEEAQKISKENNQPILIYFTGSDWCAPCKALKSDFFETAEFANRAENLVLVMIDYPRRVDIISETQRAYNKTVISEYNAEKSFPTLVMLNKKGKELSKLSGYSSYSTYKDTSHHFNLVDEALAKYH